MDGRPSWSGTEASEGMVHSSESGGDEARDEDGHYRDEDGHYRTAGAAHRDAGPSGRQSTRPAAPIPPVLKYRVGQPDGNPGEINPRHEMAAKDMEHSQLLQSMIEANAMASSVETRHLKVFDSQWRDSHEQWREKLGGLEMELQGFHDEQLDSLKALLHEEYERPPRRSNELVSLRWMHQQCLAQRRLQEAAAIQVKADALEEQEVGLMRLRAKQDSVARISALYKQQATDRRLLARLCGKEEERLLAFHEASVRELSTASKAKVDARARALHAQQKKAFKARRAAADRALDDVIGEALAAAGEAEDSYERLAEARHEVQLAQNTGPAVWAPNRGADASTGLRMDPNQKLLPTIYEVETPRSEEDDRPRRRGMLPARRKPPAKPAGGGEEAGAGAGRGAGRLKLVADLGPYMAAGAGDARPGKLLPPKDPKASSRAENAAHNAARAERARAGVLGGYGAPVSSGASMPGGDSKLKPVSSRSGGSSRGSGSGGKRGAARPMRSPTSSLESPGSPSGSAARSFTPESEDEGAADGGAAEGGGLALVAVRRERAASESGHSEGARSASSARSARSAHSWASTGSSCSAASPTASGALSAEGLLEDPAEAAARRRRRRERRRKEIKEQPLLRSAGSFHAHAGAKPGPARKASSRGRLAPMAKRPEVGSGSSAGGSVGVGSAGSAGSAGSPGLIRRRPSLPPLSASEEWGGVEAQVTA